MSDNRAPGIGVDSCVERLKGEGIPAVEDFGVDLFKVDKKPCRREPCIP